jgi:DtxR family Mn-dependent transcriptional regulator
MNSIDDELTSSLEDCLEAIVMLKEKGDKATVTALSESLGVKKPSIDWALGKLSEAGLVTHERYGDIYLTPEGARIAEEVYRRHKALFSFLTDILKVNPEIASQDACRMEHSLSRESINQLEKFIDFVLNCHPGSEDWQEIFKSYIEKGKDSQEVRDWFARKA